MIEHGIPIPEIKAGTFVEVYPEILELDVDDSFLIPDAPFGLHLAVVLFGIERNQRHVVRRVEGETYRAWRVK